MAGHRFLLSPGVFQPPRPVSLKLLPKNPLPGNSAVPVAMSPPAEPTSKSFFHSLLHLLIVSRRRIEGSCCAFSLVLLEPEVRITVSREMRQTIVGYGGAFTDAAGINIADLPPAAQEKLIR